MDKLGSKNEDYHNFSNLLKNHLTTNMYLKINFSLQNYRFSSVRRFINNFIYVNKVHMKNNILEAIDRNYKNSSINYGHYR